MCDERERLIGYVYDECEPQERRLIEEHLSTCHECRREIGGLRRVRQDLLAWEVPAHESIWRPMAPVQPASPWAALPSWTMAAAAAIALMVGAAGGVATYALLPRTFAQVAQTVPPAPVPSAAATTPAEVTGLLRRVEALEQARDSFSRVVTAQAAASTTRQEMYPAEVGREIGALKSRLNELELMQMHQTTDTRSALRGSAAQ